MDRDEQVGANAPRQGKMIQQTTFGVSSYTVMALERFPPPDFLSQTQRNLWIAALGDTPLEFFRARHIPLMIQYVRAVERMMKYSDEFEEDPDDMIAMNRWNAMIRITTRLERHLSLNTEALMSLVIRARSELRAANQQKNAVESGRSAANKRAGLTYVGH